MNIGDMRHRIQIQKDIGISDERGNHVEQWKTAAEVWASAANLYGKEFYEAAAVQAENTVKFVIRYSKTLELDTDMRIAFNGKSYDIIAIDNIKYMNRFIEIRAVKTGGTYGV